MSMKIDQMRLDYKKIKVGSVSIVTYLLVK